MENSNYLYCNFTIRSKPKIILSIPNLPYYLVQYRKYWKNQTLYNSKRRRRQNLYLWLPCWMLPQRPLPSGGVAQPGWWGVGRGCLCPPLASCLWSRMLVLILTMGWLIMVDFPLCLAGRQYLYNCLVSVLIGLLYEWTEEKRGIKKKINKELKVLLIKCFNTI